MHRRKTSKENSDTTVITLDEPTSPPPQTNGDIRKSNGDSGVGNETGNERGEIDLTSPGFASRRTRATTNGHGGWGQASQTTNGHRSRVSSVPAVPSPLQGGPSASHSHPTHPPSAGPYRTSFAIPNAPPNGVPAHLHGPTGHRHQPLSMRQSLSLPSPSSHSRARSVSGPFSPSSPSPLATSFSITQSSSYPPNSYPNGANASNGVDLSTSPTRTRMSLNGSAAPQMPSMNSQAHTRRHSRLHSRNLSVFFPRPGSLPSTTIDEDGAQEVDFAGSPSYSSTLSSEEGVIMPTASSPAAGQRTFREGFTFGARAPGSGDAVSPSIPSGASRRGHHHKHSLSHNFFSFLEPGAPSGELHTQPTLTPVSPWNPISPFPSEKSLSINSQLDSLSPEETNGHAFGFASREKSPIGRINTEPRVDLSATLVSAVQFVLGASLWVVGQQIGSLSCTGLGYWVVFDSFGVCLGRVLPGYFTRPDPHSSKQRFYGCVN